MVHKLVILRWFYRADQDFGFARSSLLDREMSFYDQICFHFQQAAEKYLKAYVVKFELPFKKEHNLVKLLKICRHHDESFKSLWTHCRYLNAFYLETRYADTKFAVTSKENTQTAFESVGQIQKVIRQKLGIRGEVTKEEIDRENRKVDKILGKK